MRIMQKTVKLFTGCRPKVEGDRTHLGVINVISRLKLYYRENAEVIYTRNKTGGTTVKIKIKTASERHE
ncbi:MAG: hypothetical protein ACLT8I_09320 [Blautia faecis]